MKKKLTHLFTLCLSLALLASLAAFPVNAVDTVSRWDGTAAEGLAGGRGTADNPYRIESASQFAFLAQSVNSGTSYQDQYLSLEADLDLSSLPWTPIGTKENPFRGNLLGNAHTISNLMISAPTRDYQGLFGYVKGTVRNLCLTSTSVTGNQYVGGLAGGGEYFHIVECNVSGVITGQSYVGGFIGRGESGNTGAQNCVNHADIKANGDYAGGIAGTAASFIYCLNTGTVSANGQYAGGIAGAAMFGRVLNCINTGTIGGDHSTITGGIAGSIFTADADTPVNCANLGEIHARSDGRVGGIAGVFHNNYSMRSCYNAGNVSDADKSGALIGEGERGGVVDCYALEGTADDLIGNYTKSFDGVAFLNEMNTAAFAATLNGGVDTGKYGVWLQEPNIYDGYPFFEPRIIQSLAITTPPTKTNYIAGEIFDMAGMVVSAFCTDGSYMELSPNSYTLYPGTSRPLTTEDKAVTAFYSADGGNLIASCDITVQPNMVAGFTDVHTYDYFAGAVEWAVENEITNGMSETTFAPEGAVTRAQAVTFLWRAYGKPQPTTNKSPFSDVADSTQYYYEAVLWAYEEGITNGVTETEFGVAGTLAYDQILTFLCRADGAEATGDDWSSAALNWAKSNGLTDGLSFAAKDNCPRADVVYCLWKQS